MIRLESSDRETHSSSMSSSISTPPLSENEQERDELSIRSSRGSSLNEDQNQEPFVLLRDPPIITPTTTEPDQSVDLLDLFSTPPVPISQSIHDTHPNHVNNLLDDSLSSVSSYENQQQNNINSDSSEQQIKQFDLPLTTLPSKSSSPSVSVKGKC